MLKWVETRPKHQSVRKEENQEVGSDQRAWVVVLAGSHGFSDQGFPEVSTLQSAPLQYRLDDNRESFVQRTWKLAKTISPSRRILTVMDHAHWGYVWQQLAQESLGRMVWQPENRGTALSVFLPLSYIRFHNPDGTVVIWPMGELESFEESIVEAVRHTAKTVEHSPDLVFALSVPFLSKDREGHWRALPDEEAGRTTIFDPRTRGRFISTKPPKPDRPARREGEMYTGILVAKVERLWQVGWEIVPEVMTRLERLGPVLGTSTEQQVLLSLFRTLSPRTLGINIFPAVCPFVSVVRLDQKPRQL